MISYDQKSQSFKSGSGPATRSRSSKRSKICHGFGKNCGCGKGLLLKHPVYIIKGDLLCDDCEASIGPTGGGWFYQCARMKFHGNNTYDLCETCHDK